MSVSLQELARMVGGVVVGDGTTQISGVASLEDACSGCIALLSSKKYLRLAKESKASALVVPTGLQLDLPVARLETPVPDLAFSTIVEFFQPSEFAPEIGLHPTAVVADDAQVAADASIGACCVVGKGATIGGGTVLHPLVYVGPKARIGARCVIYPQVVIRERVVVGDNVILHPGVVLGADGFGFATVDGLHHKIPQKGTVVIEDDVEIGANSTVDRARFGETRIGAGTKIDNLVHIAHNVRVGKRCLIVAGSMIAGSSEIGEGCIVAGQAGITDHTKVGPRVVVSARSGVTKDIPSDQVVGGFPARPLDEEKRIIAARSRLPEILSRIRSLEKRLAQLEKTSENHKA